MKTLFENENLVLVPETFTDHFMIGRLSALKGASITIEKNTKEPKSEVTRAVVSKKEILAALFKDVV